MDKKSFTLIVIILLVTFAVTLMIRFYRPASAGAVNFDDFPLQLGDWQGDRDTVSATVLELLNPQDIFSATYVNRQGVKIHLLFDYFSSDASFGGPHSPRNCLPGSGWVITETVPNDLQLDNHRIEANRFELRLQERQQVMDFWYVTGYGETANDYTFKLYMMLSALTFRPRDVAFVRFVTDRNPQSLEALQEFQKLAIKEIYARMPFGL